ncbi:hypothetical protein PPM_4241 [Paenibacillus polymyxa M1]|nr:hypothetical protein PPM_4241 [Paenibacillus polymyxa M1]
MKKNAAVSSFYTFLKEGTRATMITHRWSKAGGKMSVFCMKEKLFCVTYRDGAWQYFFVVPTAM